MGEDGDTVNLVSDLEPDNSHKQFKGLGKNKVSYYKIRKLLVHGSFYVIGLCVLIGGGIASRFHPHVDPEEYSNCSTFDNSSLYSSGDMILNS